MGERDHLPRTSTIRDHSPSLHHLRYLPWAVLLGPNSSSGRSRHEEPLSITHSIAQSTCRSSRLGRPWPGLYTGNRSPELPPTGTEWRRLAGTTRSSVRSLSV